MVKTIKYVINPDGTITLDFNGFRGKVCVREFEKILKELEKNFGVTVENNAIKQDLKPEYYQEEVEVVEQ
ncbi:hypothetical protein DRP04_02625 [Archaeoglobales archaeon]|nr:MAG: hypothetical protein DRP04_02625 [Archaeoglobales archaeon]HDN74280.1 DUF2997 domain-containing protein [Archaeoglobus sp.]